jgi:hypothetical protein
MKNTLSEFRDFVFLQYAMSRRDDTPYWKHITQNVNLGELQNTKWFDSFLKICTTPKITNDSTLFDLRLLTGYDYNPITDISFNLALSKNYINTEYYKNLLDSWEKRKQVIDQHIETLPSHLKFLETEKIHSKNKILLSGTSSKETLYDFKERNIDILITASFMGDAKKLFLKFKDSYHDLLIKKTLEYISKDKYLRVADALKIQSKRLGYQINFNNAIDLEIASLLHSYQRIIDRNNIIKTICSSPYKVTLIGEGWENFLEPCPNVVFLNSMATENVDSYIQRLEETSTNKI